MGPRSPDATVFDQRPGVLVARDAELDVIGGLVDRPRGAVRALVLEGEPGVGKTSLWERGTALAHVRGMRVLVARASEAETGLPFAGLIDLFDGVDTEELATVPAPQLHALEVALYRADAGVLPPTDQVVSLALLSAVRVLAEREPVLIAVDDVQWLDPSSQVALAYVARRLQSEDLAVLLSRRPGAWTSFESAFDTDLIERLPVRTISLGATRQLLASRLGLRLPHHLLRRVYDTTLGNPLFALEVGRLLAGQDIEALGEDLPVPEAVEDVLGLRVADLDATGRRVLLALALDADLRIDQVQKLAGNYDLEQAAEVVRVDGDRVRAAHPLLAATAKRAASDDETRRLHGDLAGVVVDEQRAALHLALACIKPDPVVAARLDAAVAGAVARGSTRLAVDLATHALRLTPDGAADSERVMTLARLLFSAGEKQRLTDLLAPRVDVLADREDRVQGHLLLTGGVVRDNDEILELLQRALDAAGDDAGLRLRVLCHLAENEAVIEVRNVALADARAAEAVAASVSGTAEDRRLALYTRIWTGALRGAPVAGLAEQHDALPGDPAFLARTPDRVVGQQHVWRGETAPARARFEAFRSVASERAEPSPYALARLHLCELELRTGRWDAAAELLDEWEASIDSSLLHWPMYERCRGLLHAGRGDAVRAREWGARAVAQADAMGIRWDWLEATRTLGLAALIDKDPAEGARYLRTVWAHARREGVLDPGTFPAGPDLVEALVDIGSYDEARRVVDELAEAADGQDHAWARLAARRGAASIALAEDWSEPDAAQLATVATAYGELGLAFDEARTWLLLGRAERRSRKWGAARTSLERAVEQFDAMGSPGWSSGAHAELDRVGARRPAGDGQLTTSERRTAELAAQGLANKEIARALVVTVSTVEFHLRNTYTKLGIRSRVELASRLQELDEPSS